jgi:NADP-dependent 3-hydroxy acid dehydrogenase YdfG
MTNRTEILKLFSIGSAALPLTNSLKPTPPCKPQRPLDLLKEETISAAAEWIASQHGQLDVLVNNAGIVDSDDRLPSSADLDAVRRVFDVNFFGALAKRRRSEPALLDLHRNVSRRQQWPEPSLC